MAQHKPENAVTEDRILEYLGALINFGVIVADPEIVAVEDGSDGGLTIEAGEHRYAVTLRRVGPALYQPVNASDDVASHAGSSARSELERMLEEGHEDVERNGWVPPEEVARMLDQAMARGVAQRCRSLQEAETAQKRKAG